MRTDVENVPERKLLKSFSVIIWSFMDKMMKFKQASPNILVSRVVVMFRNMGFNKTSLLPCRLLPITLLYLDQSSFFEVHKIKCIFIMDLGGKYSFLWENNGRNKATGCETFCYYKGQPFDYEIMRWFIAHIETMHVIFESLVFIILINNKD